MYRKTKTGMSFPALLLAVFVGINMLQASFTGFCPAAIVFGKLGFKPGSAFQ